MRVSSRAQRGNGSASADEDIYRLHHVEQTRRLYIGITSKLQKRVFEHKHKLLEGFTSRYSFDMLVHYEKFANVISAIEREKELKGWRREKKLALILAENRDWADLSLEWQEDPSWSAVTE